MLLGTIDHNKVAQRFGGTFVGQPFLGIHNHSKVGTRTTPEKDSVF